MLVAKDSGVLKNAPRPSLAELLDRYRGILIKNPDGTIDKVDDKKVDLFDFIKDGHFICRFNRWKGNFNCSDSNLTSLEGAPREVGGGFDCCSNNLISLEGAPEKIGGDFYHDGLKG